MINLSGEFLTALPVIVIPDTAVALAQALQRRLALDHAELRKLAPAGAQVELSAYIRIGSKFGPTTDFQGMVSAQGIDGIGCEDSPVDAMDTAVRRWDRQRFKGAKEAAAAVYEGNLR